MCPPQVFGDELDRCKLASTDSTIIVMIFEVISAVGRFARFVTTAVPYSDEPITLPILKTRIGEALKPGVA